MILLILASSLLIHFISVRRKICNWKMASCDTYLTKEKEDELMSIACAIVAAGKGILAADESTGLGKPKRANSGG